MVVDQMECSEVKTEVASVVVIAWTKVTLAEEGKLTDGRKKRRTGRAWKIHEGHYHQECRPCPPTAAPTECQ